MLATLLVVCLVYDSPAVHPRVGAEEKQFLLSFQLQSQSKVILMLILKDICYMKNHFLFLLFRFVILFKTEAKSYSVG